MCLPLLLKLGLLYHLYRYEAFTLLGEATNIQENQI